MMAIRALGRLWQGHSHSNPMSAFFRRRRKGSDPKSDSKRTDGAGPPADEPEKSAYSADSPTLFDVRQAQSPKHAETWNGSWERLSDKVYSFLARRFDRDKIPFDVEFDDFFSAVLSRMLRDLPNLEVRGRREFWGWVKKIAANQLIDMWRRHRRLRHGGGRVAQQVDEGDNDLVAGAVDPGSLTPSGFFMVRELEGAEEECVNKITNEQARKIYMMRRRDGLDYEEIAQRVGSESADSVRATFSRVKGQVHECLRRRLDGYTELLVAE